MYMLQHAMHFDVLIILPYIVNQIVAYIEPSLLKD